MKRRALVIPLFLLTLVLSACRNDDLLSRLHPRLKEVESQQESARHKLEALGSALVGQTTPQLGFVTPPEHFIGIVPQTSPHTEWVQLDLLEAQEISAIALIPVQTDWRDLEHPMNYFPTRFRLDISEDPTFQDFYTVASFEKEDFPDPGIYPEVFAVHEKRARYVRLTVTAPEVFALSELMVLKGNRNIAIGSTVGATISTGFFPRWDLSNLADGRTPLGPPILPELLPYDGIYVGPPPTEEESQWMQLDLGREMPIDEIRIHPVHGHTGVDVPGYRFPEKFRFESAIDPAFANSTVIFETKEPYPHPGNAAVTIPTPRASGRYIRITFITDGMGLGYRRFGLSEIEVYSGGINVARHATVETSPDNGEGRKDWPKNLLVDGCTSQGWIIELPKWLNNWTQRRALKEELARLGSEQMVLMIEARQRLWWVLGGLGILFGAGVAGVVLHARSTRKRELDLFRRQLANDFHDEIGSSLAAIVAMSNNAAKYPPAQPTSDFQKISRIARETTDAMHETLWTTGSRSELSLDLMKHLQLAATRMLPRQTVTWVNTLESFPSEWPVEARRNLFLFFKETLANIVRHSRADTIELSVKIAGGHLELEIRDNGRGFQPNAANAGVGLQSLRQRATALRGTMEIQTTPGTGTHVFLRVPTRQLQTT